MAPEWGNLYGNRITRDVTSSLRSPDLWILQAIFRAYQNDKDKLVNKCITITFWGDEVEQPIITVGKIVYSDISKRSQWDLWNIWFYWLDANEDNDYELDGRVHDFQAEEYEDMDHIDKARVFSLPLISITDDEVLIEKIIKPLKKL